MKYFLMTFVLSLFTASFGFAQTIEPEGDEFKETGSLSSEFSSLPNRLWRTELSGIVGTPAVMGDQIFVITIEGGRPRCFLYGLSLNGESKWKRRISIPRGNNLHSMRIVIGGDRIFVVSNEEIQVFSELGKPLWTKSLQKPRGKGSFQIYARKNLARFSTSLTQAFYNVRDDGPWQYRRSLHVAFQHAIVGQESTQSVDQVEVYVHLEGKKSTNSHGNSHKFSINNENAGPFNEATFSSFCTPELFLFWDMRVAIQADGLSLTLGHFRWNGKVIQLESLSWKSPSENFSIATNDCVDGNLVLLSGDRLAALILKFDEAAFGPGSHKTEVEGTDNYGLFRMCFRHDTPIASVLQYDKLVYLMDKKGRLICLDPETKKECYRTLLMTFGHASAPVASNGKIYVMNRDGHVAIFKPGPKFQLESEFELSEEIVGSPVIVDNVIYISTTKAICAFRIGQETSDKFR